MENNTWYNIRKQSLSIAARNAGFDLAVYEQYSAAVKNELRRRSIKAIMTEIRNAFWDSTDEELDDLKRGIYVISVSKPLTIRYNEGKNSDVIYIGIGNVSSRIEQHFHKSLFDFMQSLSGADFDFKFAKPFKSRAPEYYKHIEYEMLEYFRRAAGQYPLLNTNAGSNKGLKATAGWWTLPLKSAGKTPRWGLVALPESGFAKLD